MTKIALRLAVLALGAASAYAPALAQDYNQAPAQYRGYEGRPLSPGVGPNADPRYGLYNEEPTPGLYNQATPADRASADCAARFQSYDPATGTFLGYDGRRHPCP